MTVEPPVLAGEPPLPESTRPVLPSGLDVPPLPPALCAPSFPFDELEQAANMTAAEKTNAGPHWIRR
jgi:hypothetical protein